MMKYNNKAGKKGVSLFISVIILAVLLGICLGLTSILIAQLKTVRGMEESVTAFYAADTGIEMELYEANYLTQAAGFSYSGFLDLDNDGIGSPTDCPDPLLDSDDACYKVILFTPGDSFIYGVQAIGVFKETRRAIEVKF